MRRLNKPEAAGRDSAAGGLWVFCPSSRGDDDSPIRHMLRGAARQGRNERCATDVTRVASCPAVCRALREAGTRSASVDRPIAGLLRQNGRRRARHAGLEGGARDRWAGTATLDIGAPHLGQCPTSRPVSRSSCTRQVSSAGWAGTSRGSGAARSSARARTRARLPGVRRRTDPGGGSCGSHPEGSDARSCGESRTAGATRPGRSSYGTKRRRR